MENFSADAALSTDYGLESIIKMIDFFDTKGLDYPFPEHESENFTTLRNLYITQWKNMPETLEILDTKLIKNFNPEKKLLLHGFVCFTCFASRPEASYALEDQLIWMMLSTKTTNKQAWEDIISEVKNLPASTLENLLYEIRYHYLLKISEAYNELHELHDCLISEDEEDKEDIPDTMSKFAYSYNRINQFKKVIVDLATQ